MDKPKRKMTEAQLANLKPVSSKSEARERGRAGGLKKKENEPIRKAHEEIKKQIIEETYGQIYDRLIQGKLNNSELLNLFGNTIKISGDLIQKQEIDLPESLNINVIKKD